MKGMGSMIFAALILMIGLQEIPAWITGAQTKEPRTATIVGVIMDSKCATTGSHEANMKRLGAKDARDCTLKCGKDGSFVLYDAETKTVYQLNDQEKPAAFAGQKVKITGPYDGWSQTIEIQSIEPATEI